MSNDYFQKFVSKNQKKKKLVKRCLDVGKRKRYVPKEKKSSFHVELHVVIKHHTQYWKLWTQVL